MAATPPVDLANPALAKPTAYAWVVFGFVFALLISDYMARQVLAAVFPLLKAEWALSDGQLGWLSGIVALTVGLLTLPLSLAADRYGRIASITAMALLWSAATVLCSLARDYPEMLAARLLVGVGEAAYGGVGVALLLMVFPERMRATVTAAFLAGGLFGQVAGVALGGLIATHFGWRAAFGVIGFGGLMLGLIFPLAVRGKWIAAAGERSAIVSVPATYGSLSNLFRGRLLIATYIAGGLQFYVVGALPAWLPTFLVRYHGLPIKQAASLAALFLMLSGLGMILWGISADRLAPRDPSYKARFAAAISLACATASTIALLLPIGTAQLVMLAAVMFFAAGTTGVCGAIVAARTPPELHASALALLSLCYSILGLAPGPILTGWLADHWGLLSAFWALPIAGALSGLVFLMGLGRSEYSVNRF